MPQRMGASRKNDRHKAENFRDVTPVCDYSDTVVSGLKGKPLNFLHALTRVQLESKTGIESCGLGSGDGIRPAESARLVCE